jgi:hypothetical protein
MALGLIRTRMVFNLIVKKCLHWLKEVTYVLRKTIKGYLNLNFNKCDYFVYTADFHNSNAVTEKFYMLLVTRSNLGVL